MCTLRWRQQKAARDRDQENKERSERADGDVRPFLIKRKGTRRNAVSPACPCFKFKRTPDKSIWSPGLVVGSLTQVESVLLTQEGCSEQAVRWAKRDRVAPCERRNEAFAAKSHHNFRRLIGVKPSRSFFFVSSPPSPTSQQRQTLGYSDQLSSFKLEFSRREHRPLREERARRS